MKMEEYVSQIAFTLGLPANENIEECDFKQGVLIAFRELKKAMRTPVDKTVPYSTRIDLLAVGIKTKRVLYVQPAEPKLGLTLGSIESGNVFQVAAAVNVYSTVGQGNIINIDPIMKELALNQVRNTLSTDFQWRYDTQNQVVYCTHKDPIPVSVTIRYVPIFEDVSEIDSDVWTDYLFRMALANCKIALGRSRSKYTIEGSNVTLDGEALLAEGNQELQDIRAELKVKPSKLVVLN